MVELCTFGGIKAACMHFFKVQYKVPDNLVGTEFLEPWQCIIIDAWHNDTYSHYQSQ